MNLVNEGVLPPDELDDRDERREEQERARSRETVADIVADLRKCAQRWKKLCEGIKDGNLREALKPQTEIYSILADRLEAAWKRELDRAVEHATRHAEAVARDNCRDCVHNPSGRSYEGGNAAAMREAVRDIVTALANVILPPRGKADEDGWLAWVRAMQAKARAALADATTEKSSAVGNAAAMREALVFLRDQELWMLEGNVRHCVGLTVFGLEQACKIMRGVIEEALSAPPRNCDVGTPEEQAQRFHDLCIGNSSGISGMCEPSCPCKDCFDRCQCLCKWAQMPYKAEEGGAK